MSADRVTQTMSAQGNSDIGAVLMIEQCGERVWQSVNADTNLGGEVFGGQYLGLAVKVAMLSAPGRTPHALSSFFLRGAQAARPVVYEVECTRDGRAFAHRRITARQNGKEVFRAEVSFHEWEDDQPSHEAAAPDVPAAESLSLLHLDALKFADRMSPVAVQRIQNRRTFDSLFVDPEAGLIRSANKPEITAWLRPNPPPPSGDAVAYYATLAYLSDACANFPSRVTHSTNLHDGQLTSASLNHAVWFHAPICSLEQVLFVLDSPFAGGGLGYSRGTLFGADGQVLASIVQDALIRRQRR